MSERFAGSRAVHQRGVARYPLVTGDRVTGQLRREKRPPAPAAPSGARSENAIARRARRPSESDLPNVLVRLLPLPIRRSRIRIGTVGQRRMVLSADAVATHHSSVRIADVGGDDRPRTAPARGWCRRITRTFQPAAGGNLRGEAPSEDLPMPQHPTPQEHLGSGTALQTIGQARTAGPQGCKIIVNAGEAANPVGEQGDGAGMPSQTNCASRREPARPGAAGSGRE